MYHKPVLLEESVEGLNIDPKGIYVDVTFGGGGHSKEILKRLTTGRLIAFDQDEEAEQNAPDDERFELVKANFRYLKNYLKLNNALPISGLLADLGVSSHQFDTPERGFSTRYNGDLDMRMSTGISQTAADIINTYPGQALKKLFSTYGEVKNAGKLSRVICESRAETPISTIAQFKEAIASCIPPRKENKYLAQVFQALRIEVNDEIEALKAMLLQCGDVIKEGGRLSVISYHSLEDRLVKNYMRSGKFEGEVEKDFYGNPLVPFKAVGKPITATEEEIEENSRARSARLRVAEKV